MKPSSHHPFTRLFLLAAALGLLVSLVPALSTVHAQAPVIGIEAGHTKSVSGASTCDKQGNEYTITRDVALKAAQLLKDRGYSVTVFQGDPGTGTEPKSKMVGFKGAAFLALHTDYCPTDKETGAPVIISGYKVGRKGGARGTGLMGSNDASDQLAQSIWDNYGRVTGLPQDHEPGHFTNNMLYYYAFNQVDAGTPAALIEMGWMSGDGAYMFSEAGQNAMAQGVADGLAAFVGPSGAPEAPPPSEPPAAPPPSNPPPVITFPQTNSMSGFGVGSPHIRVGRQGLTPYLDAQQEMGLGFVREELPWELVGVGPNDFRWSYNYSSSVAHDYHYLLDELGKRKIKPVMLLDYGPRYLPGDPNAGYHVDTETLLRYWRAYVQAAVDEFGGQVDYWEIGNEMNSRDFWGKVVVEGPDPSRPDMAHDPEPELYARMLRIAHDVIKQKARNDVVILGGLVSVTDGSCTTSPYEFLRRVQATGEWDAFDAVAIHPYWGANTPETAIDRGAAHDPATGACAAGQGHYDLAGEVRAVRDLVGQFGQKQVWVTELGWNEAWLKTIAGWRKQSTDLIEADYVTRTYVPLLSEPGVAGVLWYTQVDDPAIAENFALGEPGRRALGNLSALLRGSRPLGQVQGQNDRGSASDDDAREYRFQKGAQTIVVLWKARGGDVPRSVEVHDLPAGSWALYPADAVDLDEPQEVLTAESGRLSVALTERPVFLVEQGVDPGDIWSRITDGIEQWWAGVVDGIEQWAGEQKEVLAQKLEQWLAEQKEALAQKFEQWLTEQLDRLAQAIERQIEQALSQMCGTSMAPGLFACAVGIAAVVRRRRPPR